MNIEKTQIYNWFEKLWNQGKEEMIDKMLHPQSISYGLANEGPLKGPQEWKAFYLRLRSQFTNIHVKVVEVAIEDDIEMARCFITATHKETGVEVTIKGSCKARFEEGMIKESWNNFDFEGINNQVNMKMMHQ